MMTGVLISTSGRRYPIVRGIPRFVGAEYYTSSFGYEWNRWPRVQFEVENVGRTMARHTTRMWEAATLIGQGKIEGQRSLSSVAAPGGSWTLCVVRGALL